MIESHQFCFGPEYSLPAKRSIFGQFQWEVFSIIDCINPFPRDLEKTSTISENQYSLLDLLILRKERSVEFLLTEHKTTPSKIF